MLLWLNGPFGAGKTTTASALIEATCGRFRHFDPEWVGFLVRSHLSDHDVADFQDFPPWRSLVPTVASAIATFTGMDLVAVQTVTNQRYWAELHAGLRAQGLDPVHVLLDCEADALRHRIIADEDGPGAAQWRLDHVDAFREARPWMLAAADVVVDVSTIGPAEAARTVLSAVGIDRA